MTQNHFVMRPAEEINAALERLPTARKLDLATVEGDTIRKFSGFKGIEVNYGTSKEVVACPTDRYTIVQHKDAFRPLVEGLVQSGVEDFKFVLFTRDDKAELQIYVGDEDAIDTVQLGIRCYNSFDGSSALHYGFGLKQRNTTVILELCAFRQVCKNGMKLWIPLKTEEEVKNAEKAGEEVAIKVRKEVMEKVLYAYNQSIRHTASAHDRVQRMQYIVEALAMLQDPVREFVERMQAWTIKDRDQLNALIAAHVGKRYAKKVKRAFELDKDSGQWSLYRLYNAMTYAASHDVVSDAGREGLLNRAAKMPMTVFAAADGSTEVQVE